MSTIDKMTVNEQLFTELTPKQAAVVEGGAWLYLYKATAVKAGADPGYWNGDDVYARVNGDKTSKTNDVDTGETANFSYLKEFRGTASINLFDDDGRWSSDEYLGGFTVNSTPTNGLITKRISGGGSTYDVTYAVTNFPF